jgi:DUF438 domain-containing protein
MDEKELIELKSLLIDLNDKSSVNELSQAFNELKNNGYTSVTVDIKTSPEQELKKSQIDIELFRKIKEVQELPDWVVINLILAAGKLKSSSFRNRILNG